MSADYNPEQHPETCGWCDADIEPGEQKRLPVDGKPMTLCPDCQETYAECEPCGRKRPGVRTVNSDAWTVGSDRTSACEDCRTYPG